MPCKDTKSMVSVRLDSQDRLIDFDFSKVTCGKGIGVGPQYKEYCIGMNIDEILAIEFPSMVEKFDVRGSEDQFLLFLEWDALRAILSQYLGKDEELDPSKYQIASIVHDGEEVEVHQLIHPPESMPKVVSCHVRAKQESN